VKAVIVDDEPLARDLLRRLLAAHSDVTVVTEAGDGDTAIRAITATQPDVVFLDIELPGRDGFGVLAELASPPVIVFVTAHPRYAVRAFEVSALDYLCKPFDDERLAKTLVRVRERLADPAELRRAITELARGARARLAVREGDTTVFLAFDQIECIEVSGKHVAVHTPRSSHTTRDALAAIEQRLDERFVRIHRSTIINLDHLRAIRPWFAGDQHLTLTSGREVTTGRGYRDRLLSRIR
jgi:two-component system LytT family response regulator